MHYLPFRKSSFPSVLRYEMVYGVCTSLAVIPLLAFYKMIVLERQKAGVLSRD